MMVLFILVVGLILRLISLSQSLWLDEATSALVAKMPLGDIFTKFLPNDVHPPLYYLILKYWSYIFGYSEISLRAPSVIFGIGAVYMTYLIAKKLTEKKVGIIASLLLATSGLAIYYSQEARLYSLAAFLVSLSIYFYLEKKWVWFSVSLMLITLTDYVALFVVPVFFLLDRKNWRKVSLSIAPALFGFLVWSPFFIKQFSDGIQERGSLWWQVMGAASVKNVALIPVKFILGRISFADKILYGLIVIACTVLFTYLLTKARKAKRILWIWLTVPIAIGIVASFFVPTLSYFKYLFCLPAFYVLVSVGINRVVKYRYLLLGLVLLVNISSALYYLADSRFHREDWRALAHLIGSNKIVFPSDSQKEALIYYGKAGQIIRVGDIAPNDSEIWLSRYVWEIVDPGDATRLKLEALGYNKAQEHNFNGVVLFKYTKNLYARRN